MKHLSFLTATFLLLFPQFLPSQSFISYFTGDTTDVSPTHYPGICLMGGATEDDNAMRWFLQRANGGDVVVIRASGSNGYNDYFYTELGVPINSVESIVMPNAASALEPYVAQQIRNAEALWIAGGDQTKYHDFWKDKPVEDALRYLIHDKKVVIGGTSAGMAILSEAYFRAANGTVTSAQALANPFDTRMDIGNSDFLDHPQLRNLITDTHYDNPNRRGRHFTFLARLTQLTGIRYRGIACEEYTAVCVDTTGIAQVFGDPASQDFAYFLQVNCPAPFEPEVCQTATPLHWVRDSQAVKVCRIKGTANGANTFDLNDWYSNTGGEWQNWWSENGTFKTAVAPEFLGCASATSEADWQGQIVVFPNPASDFLQVKLPEESGAFEIQMVDLQGKIMASKRTNDSLAPREATHINIANFPKGMYWLRIRSKEGVAVRKVVVE